jgi:hypothetical protein
MAYPTQLFTNNAISLLAAPIGSGDVTLRVMSGMGALFPQPTGDGSDYFLVTLEDQGATVREIIRVVGRSGDVFTEIIRAQEGTAARAWNAVAGDDTIVDHRITAETMRLAMLLPEMPAPVTPGIPGVITEDEGTVLPTAATAYDFVGAGVTVTGTGTLKTVTIPGAPAPTPALNVQDEGTALGVATTLNFVGSGITVTGAGAVKTVTVPGTPATPLLVVEDEGTTLGDATILNFVGGGVTVTSTGTVLTVTIPSAPAQIPLILQDHGIALPVGISNINFTGGGVTVTGSGANATVSIPAPPAQTPLVIQDEAVQVAASATTLNFVGAGVTATSSGTTTTVTIPGAPAPTDLTVLDEGVSLPTGATSLNFVGAGVTVTGSGVVKTVTIPGGSAGSAWIYGANTGPTAIDPGWDLPISGAAYGQFNRGFKFMVTIVMTSTGASETFEILANISGNIVADTEDVTWVRFARTGYNFSGSISIVLDKPNDQFTLQWHNTEAQQVQVMCTRVQHTA